VNETDSLDPQVKLRDTAADFIRMRGALQSAGALPVVIASPVTRTRLDALMKRAAAIQKTIEGAGRMIDGARKWFADTFGAKVEDSVPLANPTIRAGVQTSIAAMNYFLRDAKAELDAIIERQRQYESFPEEQRPKVLAGLAAESAPVATPAIPAKWLLIGAGMFALWIFFKGGDNRVARGTEI
jgi:hypothetical protein